MTYKSLGQSYMNYKTLLNVKGIAKYYYNILILYNIELTIFMISRKYN